MTRKDERIPLTREGLAELKQEHQELINKKRPEIVGRMSDSRSIGDMTEDSEYAQAKQELAFIDGRISELEEVIEFPEGFILPGDSQAGAAFSLARTIVRRAEREVAQLFFTEKESLEIISLNQLWERIQNNEIELLDVRPEEEYFASHISGARSIPLAELKKRMEELPKDKQIVAYCRGPYCVLSARAVKLLKKSGFQVIRLEEGVFE